MVLPLEQYGVSSEYENELPYGPAIPLPDAHSDRLVIQRDTRTSVFTAAPFTAAKTWERLNALQQMVA